MKVLFMISHPAHFHFLKHSIADLQQRGAEAIVVIRPKDVLEQLCINAKMPYIKVKDRPKKWGMLGLAYSLAEKIVAVYKIAKREKPDILIGSDGVLAVVGKLLSIPSFECFEDDVEIIGLYAKLFFPLYSNVICPTCCNAGKWDSKKVAYPSYHELAYLHPNQFTPDKKVVEQYGIDTSKPYFILRFALLKAHHDVGIHGFNTAIAQRVIDTLTPYGKVYITSERALEPQFEPYRMQINPLDMHHVMAYASLYIGDSQTMAMEAGVLGVPFIRFSDFVGKISVFKELEDHYELGYGILPSDSERLFTVLGSLLADNNKQQTFAQRRAAMLSDKVDYAKFLTWFVEHYPASATEARAGGKEFWSRFK